MRIKVNPDEAARVAADDQVMRHELAHFLTLERLAGAPTWVKEGLAEWTSTAPATLGDLVVEGDAYEHVMDVQRRLPTGGRWGLDPKADYLIGRAAVTHLVEEYGPEEVLALGAAYRRIAGDDPDEKTDRVLRRGPGISEAALVAATWAERGRCTRGRPRVSQAPSVSTPPATPGRWRRPRWPRRTPGRPRRRGSAWRRRTSSRRRPPPRRPSR